MTREGGRDERRDGMEGKMLKRPNGGGGKVGGREERRKERVKLDA